MILRCVGGPCAGQPVDVPGRIYVGDGVDVRKIVFPHVPPTICDEDRYYSRNADELRLHRYRVELFSDGINHTFVLVHDSLCLAEAFNELIRGYRP